MGAQHLTVMEAHGMCPQGPGSPLCEDHCVLYEGQQRCRKHRHLMVKETEGTDTVSPTLVRKADIQHRHLLGGQSYLMGLQRP